MNRNPLQNNAVTAVTAVTLMRLQKKPFINNIVTAVTDVTAKNSNVGKALSTDWQAAKVISLAEYRQRRKR